MSSFEIFQYRFIVWYLFIQSCASLGFGKQDGLMSDQVIKWLVEELKVCSKFQLAYKEISLPNRVIQAYKYEQAFKDRIPR